MHSAADTLTGVMPLSSGRAAGTAKRLGLVTVLLAVAGCIQGTETPNGPTSVSFASTSPTTVAAPGTTVGRDEDVLEEALLFLERESYVRDQIDWDEVRSDAYQVLETGGVERAIQTAVDHVIALDRHSFYCRRLW